MPRANAVVFGLQKEEEKGPRKKNKNTMGMLCILVWMLFPSFSRDSWCAHHLRCAVFLGKVHGSLARAGKVKSATPKVEKADKHKKPRGRAYKRILYNRRFVNVVVGPGKKKGPNSQSA